MVVRDPAGKVDFRVLEQSYCADPVSQGLPVVPERRAECWTRGSGSERHESIVRGKVVRSGYVRPLRGASVYGQRFMMTQAAMAMPRRTGTTHHRSDGKLRFSCPGSPVSGPERRRHPQAHAALADWSDQAAHVDAAELSYVTGGNGLGGFYNLIAPERGTRWIWSLGHHRQPKRTPV